MKILIFLFSLLASVSSFSDEWTNGEQIISNVIWKTTHKGFYVKPSTYHDPNGCKGTSNLYVIAPEVTDENEINRLYSMILLAFSTGKPIHAWVTGCRDTNTPKFTGLQINNQ